MKKILLIAAILSFAALAVQAQQYQVVSLVPATQTVLATGTTNFTAYVNVRKCDTAGIYIEAKLDGAGTDDIVWKFSKSPDGSHFETTPSISITNVANGTTLVKAFKAVDVTGVHTLKLVSCLNNSAAQNLTNIVVIVGVKNFIN